MKKYLAIDSGGTKVLAVVYDENFRPVAVSKTGSLRGNTTSEEMIRQNIRTLADALNLSSKNKNYFDELHGIVFGSFPQQLSPYCTFGKIDPCSEAEAGLSAAELFGDGYLALSGTGATLFARYQGQIYHNGGYGASIYDLGCGYGIGRRAFEAAIEDYDGIGPKTMLTDLIAEHFGKSRGELENAIPMIYAHHEMSPVTYVASCAPLVTKAAYAGDEVAYRILENTGSLIGKQLIALSHRKSLPKDLPITISGSAWKGHSVLFETFSHTVRNGGFTGEILLPSFEPIVGIIIRHYRNVYGKFDHSDHEAFLKMYSQYTFDMK